MTLQIKECIQETLNPLGVMVVVEAKHMFDPEKIRTGMLKATEKRPVSIEQIDKIVENIEKTIYNSLEREVASERIGELVMEGLKQLDPVAYVRFASVYRQFKDINTFMSELNKLLSEK